MLLLALAYKLEKGLHVSVCVFFFCVCVYTLYSVVGFPLNFCIYTRKFVH